MALLSVIRRWHFRDHLSIRDICRRTGLSRNTIRKYLRLNGVEPLFQVPERPRKLDRFADRLSAWLKTESKKNRKQKRTLKQLHAELMSLGYEGSYNRVAAFAREWKADLQIELQTTGRGTFVPLAFEPGEAFPFDWSEDWAIIGNERTKLQVAHTKLSYSRAFIVRAYHLQTHEMLFDAHNHASVCLAASPAWHLRQHAHGNRQDRTRQGSRRQHPLHGNGQPLPLRAGVLQSGIWLGEGRSREECSGCPSSVLSTDPALCIAGSPQRLAGVSMQGVLAADFAKSGQRFQQVADKRFAKSRTTDAIESRLPCCCYA